MPKQPSSKAFRGWADSVRGVLGSDDLAKFVVSDQATLANCGLLHGAGDRSTPARKLRLDPKVIWDEIRIVQKMSP